MSIGQNPSKKIAYQLLFKESQDWSDYTRIYVELPWASEMEEPKSSQILGELPDHTGQVVNCCDTLDSSGNCIASASNSSTDMASHHLPWQACFVPGANL